MGDHSMFIRIILGLLLLAGASTPAFSMDIKIQEWKFDKDAPGSIPVGFVPGKLNSEAGRWQVANDPKVPSRKVLVWQGTDQAAKDQIIFMDGLEAGSLDLTLRIKSAAAGEGQGAGVVFRAVDERNYYLIWLSPQEKLLRLDKLANGTLTHLQDLTLDSVEPRK